MNIAKIVPSLWPPSEEPVCVERQRVDLGPPPHPPAPHELRLKPLAVRKHVDALAVALALEPLALEEVPVGVRNLKLCCIIIQQRCFCSSVART